MTTNLILPPGVDVATHAPLVYTPDFWSPEKAYGDYRPDLEGAHLEGDRLRKQLKLRTAAQLEAAGVSNSIMLTDLQHDFRDAGRLPVIGTDTAVLRTMVRLLNGLFQDHYTRIVFSQDGHPSNHISYSTFWRQPDGSLFDLRDNKAAILSLEDERRAIFRATCFAADGSTIDMGMIKAKYNAKDTVDYWYHLQSTKQGPIWVFANHCKIGTDGTALHPLVAEVLSFAEGLRDIEATPVFKGHIQNTDWFGPLEPCRPDPSHPQGSFQKQVIDLFEEVTGENDFAGVAEDFCNRYMQEQVLAHLTDARYFEHVVFLTDCTAAIVKDSPYVKALHADARSKGVKFKTHDQPFN